MTIQEDIELSEAKIGVIEQFRQHAKDTGSPEVQIALLSERINYLTTHLKSHLRTMPRDAA